MATTTIQGHDNPLTDFDDVQKAVNNPDFDEIVLTGTFNFGGEWQKDPNDPDFGGILTDRKTVQIPRGVTIRGVTIHGRPGTIIKCGGEELPYKVFRSEISEIVVASGPFKVMVEDNQPVVIDNISFQRWKGEAILVEACHGLTVTNCTFTEPIASKRLRQFNDATFVNAIFAVDARCTGNFVAHGNVCDLRKYAHVFDSPRRRGEGPENPAPDPSVRHPQADDEQFACCFGTKFDKITVTQNRIMGSDDGVEVMFNSLNDATSVPKIELKHNFISLAHHPRLNPWPGSTGIVCCNNERADTEITGNLIITTGSGGTAFVLGGQHDSAHPFKVENNVSHQEGNPEDRHQAAIVTGSNYPMPFPQGLTPPSSPLSGAQILCNHFSGMTQFGIVTLDLVSLKNDLDITIPIANGCHWPTGLVYSRDNVISGNNLFFLDCTAPQVLLTKGTSGNNVTGCFHPDALDLNKPNNTITPKCPPVGNETLRLKLVDYTLRLKLAEVPFDVPVGV